ncbi:MAG: hypothetical protein QM621_08045 [Aeromicrobium sp.]|uniref:hypothetical protein n=1 Tax=Aeromicrobium sp. TaxID=1871063 RepID=UPI0039E3BFB2
MPPKPPAPDPSRPPGATPRARRVWGGRVCAARDCTAVYAATNRKQRFCSTTCSQRERRRRVTEQALRHLAARLQADVSRSAERDTSTPGGPDQAATDTSPPGQHLDVTTEAVTTEAGDDLATGAVTGTTSTVTAPATRSWRCRVCGQPATGDRCPDACARTRLAVGDRAHCVVCGHQITLTRRTRRHCSTACRQRAKRIRDRKPRPTTCRSCRTGFYPRRADALYCSPRCAQRARRDRQRHAAVEDA